MEDLYRYASNMVHSHKGLLKTLSDFQRTEGMCFDINYQAQRPLFLILLGK